MTVRYYEEALAEMLRGIDYYSDIHPTAGEYFCDDIQHAVAQIKQFPNSGIKHDKYSHLRIHHCKRFPYSLIYHFEQEEYNALMETVHLLSSGANAKRLFESIRQVKEGETVEATLLDE